MSYEYKFRVCTNCDYMGFPDAGMRGGSTLDGRAMFLRDGNAVVLCRRCGREHILAADVRCGKRGCSAPATVLFRPAYFNFYEAEGCCDAHFPKWLKGGEFKRLLYELLVRTPAVDYIPCHVSGKCGKCGTAIAISNKVDYARCPKCGQAHERTVPVLWQKEGLKPSEIDWPGLMAASVVRSCEGKSSSSKATPGQEEGHILCPSCGASHPLMEERIQGGARETLKQAIEIMLLMEDTMVKLDKSGATAQTTSGKRLGTFSSLLNRQHGWLCAACGQVIPHVYLAGQGLTRGIRAASVRKG